jgi:Holliday junction resolvase
VNSRSKGARGERMWRDQLREAGFKAIRGCQHSARDADGTEAPDVICPSLPGIHHEVKFVEDLNVRSAIEQANRDKKPHQIGVVPHKKKNVPWVVMLLLSDFDKILKRTDIKRRIFDIAVRCIGSDWVAVVQVDDWFRIIRESDLVEQ